MLKGHLMMLQTGQGLTNIAHHGVHLFFLDEDDGEPLAARHAGDRVFVEDILRADPGACRFGVEGIADVDGDAGVPGGADSVLVQHSRALVGHLLQLCIGDGGNGDRL